MSASEQKSPWSDCVNADLSLSCLCICKGPYMHDDDGLVFYVHLNIILSRRSKNAKERLCAMRCCAVINWIPPPSGFDPWTLWSEVGSINHSTTLTLPNMHDTAHLLLILCAQAPLSKYLGLIQYCLYLNGWKSHKYPILKIHFSNTENNLFSYTLYRAKIFLNTEFSINTENFHPCILENFFYMSIKLQSLEYPRHMLFFCLFFFCFVLFFLFFFVLGFFYHYYETEKIT